MANARERELCTIVSMKTQYFNINHFVNGKYIGSEGFNGTLEAAKEYSRVLLTNCYYSRVSIESKSGLIVAVLIA